MRQQILCDPPEGEEWRDRTCIDRTCQKCGATDASGFLKQMGINSVEATALQKVEVSYERWQREDPDNADSAYDFIRVQKPFAVFIAEMQTYFDEKYVKHHEQSVWQDRDWSHQCRHFLRGSYCSVVDYAEKYTHSPKSD